MDIDDPLCEAPGPRLGETDYEALLAEGEPDAVFAEPGDEWQAICLLYTSGTTGNPKGVVYHHRGAYLNALGNAPPSGSPPAPSICGPCPCSTAAAGRTPGR